MCLKLNKWFGPLPLYNILFESIFLCFNCVCFFFVRVRCSVVRWFVRCRFFSFHFMNKAQNPTNTCDMFNLIIIWVEEYYGDKMSCIVCGLWIIKCHNMPWPISYIKKEIESRFRTFLPPFKKIMVIIELKNIPFHSLISL